MPPKNCFTCNHCDGYPHFDCEGCELCNKWASRDRHKDRPIGVRFTEREMTSEVSELLRQTGIKVGSLRILEVHFKNEFMEDDRLELYEGFLEFERIGKYLGYLDKTDAFKLKEFLIDWITRKFGMLKSNVDLIPKKMIVIKGEDNTLEK